LDILGCLFLMGLGSGAYARQQDGARAEAWTHFVTVRRDTAGIDTAYFIITRGVFEEVSDTINLKAYFEDVDSLGYPGSWDMVYRESYVGYTFQYPDHLMERGAVLADGDSLPNYWVKPMEVPPIYKRVMTEDVLFNDSLAVVKRSVAVKAPQLILTQTPWKYINAGQPIEIRMVVGNWHPLQKAGSTWWMHAPFWTIRLQAALNRRGHKVPMNGHYGDATRRALQEVLTELGREKIDHAVLWYLGMYGGTDW
jgi:hypothetical protein